VSELVRRPPALRPPRGSRGSGASSAGGCRAELPAPRFAARRVRHLPVGGFDRGGPVGPAAACHAAGV